MHQDFRSTATSRYSPPVRWYAYTVEAHTISMEWRELRTGPETAASLGFCTCFAIVPVTAAVFHFAYFTTTNTHIHEAVFVLYIFRFRNINQGWNTRSFCVNRNRNTIPVSVDKPAQGWFIKPKPVYVCARRQQKWMGRGREVHFCASRIYKESVVQR